MLILGAIDKSTGLYTHPAQAVKGKKYQCLDCGQDLSFKKGDINIAHFAHKSGSDCTFLDKPSETQLHKLGKQIIQQILKKKIPLKINRKCSTCQNIIDEYEIPEISNDSNIVLEYRFIYQNNDKIADVAYLDKGDIVCLFEICFTNKTEESNRPEPWFEFDAKSLSNISLTSSTIELDCIRRQLCDICSNLPQSNTEIDITNLPPGKIYFNQRGAGCGKTFESIQLIQKDPRFNEKTTFIYLTRLHSAKEVIYFELNEQMERGLLSDLVLNENKEENYSNKKQYKISYHHNELNKDISLIIGTIDSFNCAIVDKNNSNNHYDHFKGIALDISNNVINKQSKYGGIDINHKCLVIIDEAQDLPKSYIEAIDKIVLKEKLDVYVIGDKLQSIWGEDNIYTYIDSNTLPTQIERSEGINKVMRFHNKHFIEFVNKIVPFKKYNLPEITDICSGQCKYKHDDEIPYYIFEIDKECHDNDNLGFINNTIKNIISYMNQEIDQHKYLPNNFMFIFPILSNNLLAITLEICLQDFWVKKFNDTNYQEILKNTCWKDKNNDDLFNRYVYLHKSDDGRSINLKESENATRILSIHSSKGLGCEVVFVLGLSEASLKIFSNRKDNLVYDSLIHVALTRQKKSLYLGIQYNNDDIHTKCTGNITNEKIQDLVKRIDKRINLSNVCNSIDNEIFNKIDQEIIKPNHLRNKIPESKEKDIIDWGHHIIRNTVLYYNILCNIVTKCGDIIEKQQFYNILLNRAKRNVVICNYSDYIEKLKEKSEDILLLSYSDDPKSKYYHYARILEKIVKQIQVKLSVSLKNGKEFPPMCPLENVILQFMINIGFFGKELNISINDVYSIMLSYDLCWSKDIDKTHSNQFKCVCESNFNGSSKNSEYKEIAQSIKIHYDYINIIDDICEKYDKYLQETLKTKITKYNLDYKLNFNKTFENFNISKRFPVIGFSDTHIIYLIIKPQFNELNFNKILCESVLNHYLLMNFDSNTVHKNNYFNKKIYTCIFTLDSNEPIFYELNIDQSISTIEKLIANHLYDTYSDKHELIYKFYKYCKNNITNKNINGLQATYKVLKDDKEYQNLPSYISKCFDKLDQEIQDDSNKKQIVQDLSLFTQELDKYLQKEIQRYFAPPIQDI